LGRRRRKALSHPASPPAAGPAAGPASIRAASAVLRGVVFVCGAVIMALEIAGSRLLAPYFGNSVFVWGSLIGIVLLALAVGYYAGGLLADRWPRAAALAGLIVVPGILIFLLPFGYPAVNRAIAATDLGTRWGPLAASLVLFLVPSCFLGTVSPYAVRLQATAVARVGTTAGVLYAISTAGSIVGTLLTAFFLIPTLGVGNIVHALGVTLVLCALALLALEQRRAWALALLALLMLMGVSLAWQARAATRAAGVLLHQDSFYHHILVFDEGGARFMDFDNLRQSAVTLADPADLRLAYTRTMLLGLAFRPEASAVLCIGLGGGSIPKRLHRDLPELRLDVVEIDPAVVRAAEQFFDLRQDDRLRVHAIDGRLFVLRGGPRYDLAFLDAYNSDTIPFHLATREFYRDLKRRLAPDGAVVSNIIGALAGRRSRLLRAMVKTIQAEFPQVYLLPVGLQGWSGRDEIRNVIVVGSLAPDRLAPAALRSRVAALVGAGRLPPFATDLIGQYTDERVAGEDVPLLTDDYAPVEALLHL
jgi:spermidine synthase